MSDIQKKMVEFGNWCKKCKFYGVPDTEDPCNYCMTQNYNDNSHIPVNYDGPRPEKEKEDGNAN